MKKIYLIQPTYSLMDGKLIKEFPLFNYSYNLPILAGCIPPDWEKQTCLEYIEDVDFNTDASIIIITSVGFDISHSIELIKEFKTKGKTIVFGAHMDDLSDKLLREICHSVFYGFPTPSTMKAILSDFENGELKNEYNFENNINYPFDYSVLRKRGMLFIPIISSLGCKFKCSYCCYPPTYHGHYRLRKLEYVISDLKQAAQLNKPLAFLDANLYKNRKFLVLLCQCIIDGKIKIRWGAQCTVTIGDDEEILQLLYKAGCRMLFLGLETLSNINMVQLNKPINVEDYPRQISKIHSTGLAIGAFFMLGLDQDDQRTFDKMYSFFQDNKIEVPYVHIYFPIPGTSMAEDLNNQGRILNHFFEDYRNKKAKFSVPCSIAYYHPAKISKNELEQEFVILFRRLTLFKNIIRRMLVLEFKIAFVILKMNLEARKKYKSMITS